MFYVVDNSNKKTIKSCMTFSEAKAWLHRQLYQSRKRGYYKQYSIKDENNVEYYRS